MVEVKEGVAIEVVEDAVILPDKMDHFELRSVSLGGKRVGYTRSTRTLHLAGDDVTPEGWVTLRTRVDKILRRAGVIKEAPNPARGVSSNFLSVNHEQIQVFKRGVLKRAPFWLRWLFEGVVTKESYDGRTDL